MTKKSVLKLRLSEDNNGDADLIGEMFCGYERKCSLKRAERLSEGLKLLERQKVIDRRADRG
jgi:hypothetical protein